MWHNFVFRCFGRVVLFASVRQSEEMAFVLQYFEYEQMKLLADGPLTQLGLHRIIHRCSKCLTVHIIVVRTLRDELIDDRRSVICLNILSPLIRRRRDYNSNDSLNSHNKTHIIKHTSCIFIVCSQSLHT